MKHLLFSPSSPWFVRLGLLVACAFAPATGSAAVYNQNFIFQANLMSGQTSGGYTWNNPSGAPGHVDVTAQGLNLGYTAYGSSPVNDQVIITNVADITGGGIQLDRYLSFTVGPDNIDELAGYSGTYTVELTALLTGATFSMDEGIEHFEIRTSMDNFASPLAGWDSDIDDEMDYWAPGTTRPLPASLNTNGTVITTDAPLEIRLYGWYDAAGGDGILGRGDTFNDSMRFNYRVTTIPEPSAVLLSGAAGLVALLRRRRA